MGRKKALEHFKEALRHKERGDWKRAAQLVRLALAFDPREKRFHEALADLLPRVNAEHVLDLRRKAEVLLARKDPAAALPFLEDAARLEPADAELADQIAALSLEMGDLSKATEFAERALSLEEDIPAFRKTRGRIYKATGQPDAARKEFQRAWQLDPMDEEVKAELARR